MKYYRVMGNYKRTTEEIDNAKTEQDAKRLCSKYQVEFGKNWHIWVEVQEYVGCHLDEIYPLEEI